MLMIADDFTGAMDTAVQMTSAGINTRVTTDINSRPQDNAGVQVLVIDAETRHLPPAAAHDRIAAITRRYLEAGVQTIYKKTDSTLRGNIGAELQGMMSGDQMGRSVLFAPAYPKIGRITKAGIHYVDGVPVDQTVFGQDPFEPVNTARLADIIAQQSPIPVRVLATGETVPKGLETGHILIVDAENGQDLEKAAAVASDLKIPRLLAGCAGFAEKLSGWFAANAQESPLPHRQQRLFVACGSINPISISQTQYAAENGFFVHTLTPEEKLTGSAGEIWRDLAARIQETDQQRILIQSVSGPADLRHMDQYAQQQGVSPDQLRRTVAEALGEICAVIVRQLQDTCYFMVGGDTLLAFMQALDFTSLQPVKELYPGVVLSWVEYNERQIPVVSKAGGFGSESVLADIADKILVSGRGGMTQYG